jgi:hypothetical protein
MPDEPPHAAEPAGSVSVCAAEPLLAVRPPPVPFFRTRPFLRAFIPVVALAVACLVALLWSGNVLLPFSRVITLEGWAASKADYFDDDQVQKLLLKHNIRIHTVQSRGSREIATGSFASLDFVFPSGQPAAALINNKLHAAGEHDATYLPFVSPIVLGTYREYAETLHRAGLATPQPASGGRPYYYDLDLAGFLKLGRAKVSWNDLGIGAYGILNGNTVLADTSNVCAANSADTYLGLVAALSRSGVPVSDQDAEQLATQIKPLLRDQGLATNNPSELYYVPEGRQTAPVIVIYEHQYLSYQLRSMERGSLDSDRVLLYPRPGFMTQPELISLNANGDLLGKLLTTDPDLRRRALELGFRVLDHTGTDTSDQLSRFLTERAVAVPSEHVSDTEAVLPEVPQLERMISVVGGCPPVGPP